MDDELLFLPASFFLVRFSLWPYKKVDEYLLDSNWKGTIFDSFNNDSVFKEAIVVASPTLAYSVKSKCTNQVTPSATSLLNYALRMATRSTPFGLFSCVSTGYWGSKLKYSIESKKISKKARPDMSLIFRLIEELYQDDQALIHLTIRQNPLVWRQDSRYYLNYVWNGDANTNTHKTVSINSSKTIDLIFEITKDSFKIEEVLKKIKTLYPKSDRHKILSLIKNLLSNQFLIPGILPSLGSNNYEELFQIHDLGNNYKLFLESVKEYNESKLGDGEKIYSEKLLSFDSKKKSPIHVDAVYEGSPIILPSEIKEDIGQVAGLLWKLSTCRPSPNILASYHAEFVEKYGLSRTVPLLEMLNEEKGLGSNFKDVLQLNEQPNYWNQWVTKILEKASCENKLEVQLEKKDFQALFSKYEKSNFHEKFIPPSIDVFAKIVAENPEQIENGDYLLDLVSGGVGGIETFGRFVNILDNNSKEKIREFIEKEESIERESMFLDISYWPSAIRCANIAINPLLRDYQLNLNEKNGKQKNISLSDIYVGADLDRFYLTLKDGSCEINARTSNRLNFSFAPDPLYFMLLVTSQKYKEMKQFSLELPSNDTTFSPRVRYGKAILSPATWNLFLDGCSKKSTTEILKEFDHWALKWRLPKRFLWTRDDQFLLCDSSHEAHRRQIAEQIKQGKKLQLKEFYKHVVVKSKDGVHGTEVVIPLRKRASSPNDLTKIPKNDPIISIKDRFKLPGSEWMYFKIYISEEMENIFLINHFYLFTEQIKEQLGIEEWFFVRYSDSKRHLRIRLHLPSLDLVGEIMSFLNKQATIWIERGLIKNIVIDSYEREIERYGGLKLIPHIERLFCVDSLAITYLLKGLDQKLIQTSRESFNSISFFHLLKDLRLSDEEILRLVHMSSENKVLLKGHRNLRSEVRKYIMALDEDSKNGISSDHEFFQEISELRQEVFESFLEKVFSLPRESFLEIVNSILHMHANRIGCDQEAETRARLVLSLVIK